MCYSFCSFFCMHICVCMSGDGMCVGACGGQRLTLNIFLDWAQLLSTEAGCLAESRAHQLDSLHSHLSLDPCSYLLSAGIAGSLSCCVPFILILASVLPIGQPQPHYCGILIEIFYFSLSFYIYLLGYFWKKRLFLKCLFILVWAMDIYLMSYSLILLILLPNCSYFNHWNSFQIGYVIFHFWNMSLISRTTACMLSLILHFPVPFLPLISSWSQGLQFMWQQAH